MSTDHGKYLTSPSLTQDSQLQAQQYAREVVQSNPRPQYPSPHNFLYLTITVALLCGFVNATSALFGGPALTAAIMSIATSKWKTAQRLGNFALYLSISNLIYTLGVALIIVASIIAGQHH